MVGSLLLLAGAAGLVYLASIFVWPETPPVSVAPESQTSPLPAPSDAAGNASGGALDEQQASQDGVAPKTATDSTGTSTGSENNEPPSSADAARQTQTKPGQTESAQRDQGYDEAPVPAAADAEMPERSGQAERDKASLERAGPQQEEPRGTIFEPVPLEIRPSSNDGADREPPRVRHARDTPGQGADGNARPDKETTGRENAQARLLPSPPLPESRITGTEAAPAGNAVSQTGAAVSEAKSRTEKRQPPPGLGESGGDGPEFDVVRIEPGGAAVIAGRAAPESDVTVLADGEPIAQTRSNARGAFVAIPQERLGAGQSELTLTAVSPSGERRDSPNAVIMATPHAHSLDAPEDDGKSARKRASGGTGEAAESSTAEAAGDTNTTTGASQPMPSPFVLKVPRTGSGGAEVLQHPTPPPTAGNGGKGPKLRIRIVQYTTRGGLVVSGRARTGRRVAVSLGGRVLGRGRADRDGNWSFVHNQRIPPGLYTLKAEALDSGGNIVAEVQTPFASQPDIKNFDDGERLVVVQPGSNLWNIARRTYGKGVQYTTIYTANQDQIADPDLIYPGQVFVLPSQNGRTVPVEANESAN